MMDQLCNDPHEGGFRTYYLPREGNSLCDSFLDRPTEGDNVRSQLASCGCQLRLGRIPQAQRTYGSYSLIRKRTVARQPGNNHSHGTNDESTIDERSMNSGPGASEFYPEKA